MTYGKYGAPIWRAIPDFTMDKIHAAKPSTGWSMRSIQNQSAIEFPLWDKDYVDSMVRSVVLQHCNIKE